MPAYVKVSDDGRYGLAAPDSYGYSALFAIVKGPKPADWPDDVVEWADYEVGLVSNPENFYSAIDAADEEMRVLSADARAEFGF